MRDTLSVAVMSGKGGVGKSNLALNLGYALSRGGFPLLLMDCDLGLANLDVLLGITPEGNLQDVLLRDAPVTDVIHPLSDRGRGVFDILPAASGVPELAEMDADMRDMLLRRLEPALEQYDMVLLDLGAGIHGTVQSFAAMAAVRLVVMTPEPTSLTDSYALIKVLHTRLGVKDFLVVINEVENSNEEERCFQRLSMACEHFGLHAGLAGICAQRSQNARGRQATAPASGSVSQFARRARYTDPGPAPAQGARFHA